MHTLFCISFLFIETFSYLLNLYPVFLVRTVDRVGQNQFHLKKFWSVHYQHSLNSLYPLWWSVGTLKGGKFISKNDTT